MESWELRRTLPSGTYLLRMLDAGVDFKSRSN